MYRVIILTVTVIAVLGIMLMTRGCGRAAPRTTYYVARDPSFYPLDLQGKSQNALAFSDAVLLAIASKANLLIELHSSGIDTINSAVERGEYDAMLSPLYPSPLNQERFLFSDPYFFTGPILLVRDESTIHSLADLKDKRVGIQTSTLVVFDIASYPSMILQRYTSPIDAIESLVTGDIDGLIMDAITAYSYIQGLYARGVKVVGPPLNQEGLRLVGNKHTAQHLIDEFNEGLAELKKDGKYLELLHQWGLDNPTE